jgi:nucleotide-binding universal stress UspA family protein
MKVLWGFEPRTQSKTAIKGMASLLGRLSQGGRDLNLGFVVTENEVYLHTAYDVPVDERYDTYPKSLIQKDLRKAGVQLDSSKIQVLHRRTLSTTKAVDHFLRLARSQRAGLVALYTRNKKGIERLIMGSFAETAIHRSRIDLLLAGPGTKYPARVRKIFYASDFGPESKRDLRRVLAMCRLMGASLTVYHAAEVIYRWSLDESSPRVKAYRREVDRMTAWMENAGKKARVRCSVVVDAEFESIPGRVLRAARVAKADLLVVSAKAGPLAALMGGSVTRSIVRHGNYPVWILKR